MREIKFRGWDTVNKRMLTGEQLDNTDDIAISFDGDELTVAFIDRQGDWNEVILQQFTGVTDKVGKEIYEGDILQLLHSKYVVENMIDFHLYVSNNYHAFCGIQKVIGNIYQHHELLK